MSLKSILMQMSSGVAVTAEEPPNYELPAGPVLHVDSSIEESLTIVAGKISQINDLSGNGNHLTQSNATHRPTLTAGKLVFGSTSHLAVALALSQPFTVILVVKQKSFGAAKEIYNFGTQYEGMWQQYASGFEVTGITNNGNPPYPRNGLGFVDDKFVVLTSVWDGNDSKIYLNNEPADWLNGIPIVEQSETEFILGSEFTNVADMDIAEAVVYNEALSAEDQLSANEYLIEKHSIERLPYIAFFGDSKVTLGSPTYPQQVCTDKGYRMYIFSTGGSLMTSLGTRKVWLENKQTANCYVSICFGTNDTIDAAWKAEYKGHIQDIINYGFPANRIILIAPYHKLGSAPTIRTYCEEIATELGLLFYDSYTYLAANGGYDNLYDDLHENQDGVDKNAAQLKLLIEEA
jgi:hypothetical protein